MAGYLVEASELTAFADAIRAINLASSEHLLQWPSNFINEIKCFSDELIMYESAWSKMLSFITSSVPSFYFYSCNYLPSNIVLSQCESIASNAFNNCTIIESVSLPECSTINSRAFFECTSLTTIYAPKCERIGEEAFVNTKLSIASFPACLYVGISAFNSCSLLTTVDLPECSTVSKGAFQELNLTTVSLPTCLRIEDMAFMSCYSLTTIDLPECTWIGLWAFCHAPLTTIYAPKCKTIGFNAFTYTNLSTASFPACTSIGAAAFSHCQYLQSLYLMGSSVVYISSRYSAYFPTTSTFKIYVPASLLNSYQTSLNWSLWSHKLVGI